MPFVEFQDHGYFLNDYDGWHFEKYLNSSPLEADLR